MRTAVGDTSVQSHLLIDFTDAAGRRWQIGYDQLVEVKPLAEGSLQYVDLAQPPVKVDEVNLPLDVEAEASAESAKVAFLSYVHEDSVEVERLQMFLESHGVTVRPHWFVPVLLSDCVPLDADIGIHGHLSDIHQCRLFEDWSTASKRLLAGIRRLS